MKKYFYTDGREKFGPFTLEELKEKNILKGTLVWFDGMDEWKPAGSIPEMSSLFAETPPPLVIQDSGRAVTVNTSDQVPPKTWLTESILVTIFCCVPFGIPGIVNAAMCENKFKAGDIEGAINCSEAARKWVTASFWTGLAAGIISIIFYAILFSMEY